MVSITHSRQHKRNDIKFNNRVRGHITDTIRNCVIPQINEYLKSHEGSFRKDFVIHLSFEYRFLMGNDREEFTSYVDMRTEVLSKLLKKSGWLLVQDELKHVAYEMEWMIGIEMIENQGIFKNIKNFFDI